ncbi:outer membrane autotransporter barrel domain-containing protein [Parasphingorhabdus marina DSM 22363]|uniref:Outer membrane autotransporter barrel domain-containing protein n=1 Tax=Parasphingorhabdus marina DSM 22363 TaxID=1123272 RepID=A0A1N6DDY1_9SPHN|nr:autotransporter outer membrane beta-barrel domain-containing protein [Parasphingorhabdus marina]SIN68854.1 outer membrane autotransporter barrel domain-containing protein [Parasphingorhabdus marina DSM 22363]
MPVKPLIFGILCVTCTANAHAKEIAENRWTIGISGGLTALENASDQHFGSASLSRDFGDSYVGLSITYVDSGDVPGLINAIPASTTELALSAGTAFDALAFDGFVSFGKRDFEVEAIERNGQAASISSDGNAFGIGVAASYDIAIDERTFITPSIGIDYNELDIARIVQGPTGQSVTIGNTEDGVTGTFGVTGQKIFGSQNNHVIAIIANVVTTSNTTSFNPGTSQSAVLRALATRNRPGQSDSWGEVGGALSLGLADNLRLDLSALQTLGFVDSDATSVSAGLRFSF